MAKYDLKNAKIIGEGSNGTCYLIKGDRVLKLFKDIRSKQEIEKFKRFLEFKNATVMFPDEFISGLFYFKGYVSDKAPGFHLDEILINTPINTVITSLTPLQNDIDYISKNHILMEDVHSDNVLFDGSKFSVIDVDSYEFSLDDSDNIRDRNYSKLCKTFYQVIIEEMRRGADKSILEDITHEMHRSLFYDFEVDNLLLTYDLFLQEYFGVRKSTFGEYAQLARRKK